MGQEAGGFELGKDAPHGRARDAETVALDQGLAADRLGGRDVFLDDGEGSLESGGPEGAEGRRFDAPTRSPALVSTRQVRVLTGVQAS